MAAAAMLVGCTNLDPSIRREQSSKIALDAGWQRLALDTRLFTLIAFTPSAVAHDQTLTIYIEGDGLAWINASTPSLDPTPIRPIALQLALRDPHQAVAYLARPCQYTRDDEQKNCSNRYWTSHRFAPEVIAATNLAIDQLKARAGATRVRLVGYSGGGAVAALAAARRNDVAMLITVAGNLDHALWTNTHRVSPLSGSLNAADDWQALQHVPQQHYVGGRDDNVDRSVAQSYAARFTTAPSITVIPDYTHLCCWAERWPDLVRTNFGLPPVTAP